MNLSSSLNNRLQYQHQTIEELISGYTVEQLKNRTVPDKWSVFENIVHLIAYQPVFQQRISRILKEKIPAFESYVAENDPFFSEYLHWPLQELLQNQDQIRSHIYQHVNSLVPEQLSQVGHHPKYGFLSLVQWIEFFLLHESHHLFTIFKLLGLRDKEIRERGKES